ncbi:MAG: hypothetical protein J6038_02340 [Bacilli bacterium]|nr:hypothetical protein [Bacilli bacterium]
MSKYATKFAVTQKMLNLCSSIMEKVGQGKTLQITEALNAREEQQILPPAYDMDAFLKNFPEERKISQTAKKIFAWTEKNQKKMHPLIGASVMAYTLTVASPLNPEEYGIALLEAKAVLANFRAIFLHVGFEEKALLDKRYQKAIDECAETMDMGPYISFLLEKIDEAIDETLLAVTGFEGKKSPCVKKLLQIMRAGQEYSSKEIADKLGLKSRVAVKRNYLEPALKGGYIEMLLPQKPHSPNQRYHKIAHKED